MVEVYKLQIWITKPNFTVIASQQRSVKYTKENGSDVFLPLFLHQRKKDEKGGHGNYKLRRDVSFTHICLSSLAWFVQALTTFGHDGWTVKGSQLQSTASYWVGEGDIWGKGGSHTLSNLSPNSSLQSLVSRGILHDFNVDDGTKFLSALLFWNMDTSVDHQN